mgnify:CR=1 FL=1
MTTTLEAPIQNDWQALQRAGAHTAALRAVRDLLRRGCLPPHRVAAAGRYICAQLAAGTAGPVKTSVRILGQCTTSFLVPVVTAEAWGRGVAARVTDGEYDNVVQELMRDSADADTVVLLPWHQRLLADDARDATQRIDDELSFLRQAHELVRRSGARLVQVGYDWLGPGAWGYHLGARQGGPVQVVRELNAKVRASLPAEAYFVDLEQIAGMAGRERFYDLRNYRWTRQPFSDAGLVLLARHLWAGIRAVTSGPKKVLVLDLDNTLWGGIVGEVGALNVQLGDSPDGEAYRTFQEHVRQLGRRGIVLAVCSKNNPADAREPFQKHPDMVLRLEDFAAFEATWDPKPSAIRRIAETLRLGLDSFVFFDDSPAEREQVRQALPEVEVVEVPADPADYVRALEEGLWFETVTLTTADQQRAAQYQAEQQRRLAQAEAAGLPEFLTSLDMRATVRQIDELDMQRVAQLLAKTNQFNLTTRRHTADEVRRLLAKERAIGLTLRLTDRFGDYGLIAVILALPHEEAPLDTLRIDTWLMSCRAIGRTVEECFFNVLVEQARARGYRKLIGEFIPSAKNGLVADLYQRLGFTPLPDGADGVRRFVLDLTEERKLPPTYVRAGG